jgi:hypothetical protein
MRFGLAFAAALTLGAAAAAQSPPKLFLSLTDASGLPITDLRPTDVSLRQGESTCVWVRLTPVKWPTKLTVLVDNGLKTSDSIADLRSSLRAFFAVIPPGIEMSLITTAPQPRWIVRPTTNSEAVVKGVDLVAPDRGTPRFIDALMEAADRIDKDRSDHFPMILAIAGGTAEGSNAKEQDVLRMFDRFAAHPLAAYIVLVAPSSDVSMNGLSGTQAGQVGSLLAKSTHGSLEAINSPNRLVSLLPDIGRRLARTYDKQTHQYQVTCDRWEGSISAEKPFSLGTTRRGLIGVSSADGRVP